VESVEVTKAEFARLTGRSKQYIGRLCDRGTLKLANGLINVVEGIKALEGLKTNGKGSSGNGNDTNGEKPTLWEEQARLAGHKADIAEMESRKLARELVEVDHIVAEFGKLVFAVRQRLLGLGSRLAPQLSKKPPAFIKQKLDAAIDEVLNEFGKYNAETGECGPSEPAHTHRKSGTDLKAKGPANRKPVGKQI